ncbi:hypothetical protein [Marinactinospora rubrisoli]|uniref:Uncharacterized protein n=1 Tax=Marinactinospora rubrisoli TaxID=2715399 RepID=A0ABW2KA64_9ACTN
MCTARDPMAGRVAVGGEDSGPAKRVWAVDHYASEGPRTRTRFVDGVRKYHRRFGTLVNGLPAAGLVPTAVAEPVPGTAVLDRRPSRTNRAARRS